MININKAPEFHTLTFNEIHSQITGEPIEQNTRSRCHAVGMNQMAHAN